MLLVGVPACVRVYVCVCRRVRGMRKSECVCVGFALACFNRLWKNTKKKERERKRARERMGVQKK